jgi:hypothetical protein
VRRRIQHRHHSAKWLQVLQIQAITDRTIVRNEGSSSTGHTGRRATGQAVEKSLQSPATP